MAIAATLVPLEEYLSTSYDPDRDYVNGELQESDLGKCEYARVQFMLVAWFSGNEGAWHVYGLTEQRIQAAPQRVRIADLCLRPDAPLENVIITPPLLCVEILSLERPPAGRRPRYGRLRPHGGCQPLAA